MKNLLSLKKYFFHHKQLLIWGIIFTLTSNFFKVYSIPLVRNVITEVTHFLSIHQNHPEKQVYNDLMHILLMFVLTYLGFSILSGFFTFLMRQTIIVASRKIEYDLKSKVYDHYQVLDLEFYKQNRTGDLMSRITEDVSRVRDFVGPAFMYSINLLGMFCICIPLMISIHWKLALISLIPLPILSYSIYFINEMINKNALILQEKLSKLTSITQEVYSGIRVVKGFVKEKTFYSIFEKEADEYKKQAIKIGKIEAFYGPFWTGIISFSMILTVYFSNRFILHGDFDLANITAFVMFVNLLTFPISALGWVANMTQRGEASMQRINEFLDVKPNIKNEGIVEDDIVGNIVFDHVSYTYPDTGILALDDINFSIPAGEQWAIVGKTGSGKSTIAEMMMRLYQPSNGKIEVDQTNIQSFELGYYRSKIGYVPQDVFLFSDTVAQNISFGRDQVELPEIKDAAQKACIDIEIEQFQNGYETMIGERGVTLSGGQKQRISIARAFLINPSILILDDCLSAVDVTTEQRIVHQLKAVFKGKTSITITHRLFNTLEFDHILVMDEGRIVERGNHEELLALKGLYHQLFYKKNEEHFIPDISSSEQM